MTVTQEHEGNERNFYLGDNYWYSNLRNQHSLPLGLSLNVFFFSFLFVLNNQVRRPFRSKSEVRVELGPELIVVDVDHREGSREPRRETV